MMSGVVTLLPGKLLWLGWPWSGEKAIGLMMGLKLLLDGVAIAGIGMTARRSLKAFGTSGADHQ